MAFLSGASVNTLTRDNQKGGVLYLLDDGTAAYCVDGEGRWYYDSADEAYEQLGEDVDYAYADEIEED